MADKFSNGKAIAEILRNDLAEAQFSGADEEDISFAIECIICQALKIQKSNIERIKIAGRFAEYLCKCISDPNIEKWNVD